MAIQNRYEFIYYLACTNANPNGDPDMGNTPRIDPETLQGLITDVATKRRIRNYVQMAHEGEPGMEMIIQQATNINRHIARAKKEAGALKIKMQCIKEGKKLVNCSTMCGPLVPSCPPDPMPARSAAQCRSRLASAGTLFCRWMCPLPAWHQQIN